MRMLKENESCFAEEKTRREKKTIITIRPLQPPVAAESNDEVYEINLKPKLPLVVIDPWHLLLEQLLLI